MRKDNIRKKFHKLIDKFEDDDQYMHYVYEAMVTYQKKSKEDDIIDDDLTEKQRKELLESIREADRGETISHEEAKKKNSNILKRIYTNN